MRTDVKVIFGSEEDIYEVLDHASNKTPLEYFGCGKEPGTAAWDFEITQDRFGMLKDATGRGYVMIKISYDSAESVAEALGVISRTAIDAGLGDFKFVFFPDGNDIVIVFNIVSAKGEKIGPDKLSDFVTRL